MTWRSAKLLLTLQEIFEAHPDVKVVLSVRDPKRWRESVKDSIYRIIHNSLTFPTSVIYALTGELPRVKVRACFMLLRHIILKCTYHQYV